jgi:membrane-bound lytic murein transglycosylase F
MGYEYDLIKDFAEAEGLELDIKVATNESQLVKMLKDGEVDVVAYPIQYNTSIKEDFVYCGHENEDCQVLVQRANRKDTILTDVTQLIGKSVYVNPHTKYMDRLRNLNEELGGGINLRYVSNDTLSVEDLIEKVVNGELPYTVCDEKIAKLNKTYFPNINISLRVSFMQRSSWIVSKDSPFLAEAINRWTDGKEGNKAYKALSKRYFELSKLPVEGTDITIVGGHISPYDALFQKYAKNINWDWRVLASIAYQESRFNPNVVSWAGAEGLMGIMPSTARRLGVETHELKRPEVGIRTGVECLRRFQQGFNSIEDHDEKIKFTLAAYNSGIGHIYDAQRLAEKYGKNPNVWDDNVAEYVRLKNEPEYYNDPVCRHGYLRGSETYKYVSEILTRYKSYVEKTR